MEQMVKSQKQFFLSNKTKPYRFRRKQLEKLKAMLQTYENDIYDALKKDLNKSKHEALTTEIGILYAEINFTLKHLKKWMDKQEVPSPLTHKGTSSYIVYEPYGCTLIMAPWNYPLQLSILPAIGAIAAGNTVVLKPSELTPHTSKLLKRMVENTFDANFFTVVEGDKTISEQLLHERFDYIFFTGSTQVGKIIMEKASKHLTPVTLELGGKSPAIVDKECQLKLAAKRIVWGKFTNAGQTCVAPDYVYVQEKIHHKFVKELKKQIISLYGKNPLQNKDYVRIVNKEHFDRLLGFLKKDQVVYGGKSDSVSLKIEPTIVHNISWNDQMMQEEIFGPILPILSFSTLDEIIPTIQQNEKPLALYYFGSAKKKENKLIESISFGGGCINDTLYHLANPHLPFGGVGHSGIGAYHGQYSFETFSHRKSILSQTTMFDIPVRYPGRKLAHVIAKRLLK